jgi:hypothetical protein
MFFSGALHRFFVLFGLVEGEENEKRRFEKGGTCRTRDA